ncbi:hypothetical protein DEM91_11665 [Prevotella sp. TCVGH]|nr:hypothetical protein [Prevotella sp. TCVGH]
MSESLFECKFKIVGSSNKPFYIYVAEMEGGGRPGLPNEQRLQFRHHGSWTPDIKDLAIAKNFCLTDNLSEKECYVICIYKPSQTEEDICFVGIYPDMILKGEQEAYSPTSVQVKIDKIQEAYINGVSIYEKAVDKRIVSFKPKYLLWYMKNRDELHLGDIEKAMNNRFKNSSSQVSQITESEYIKGNIDYLSAIRTKPFLLLAGISGTGKSRIVKEMAYASCPDEGDLRQDPASPGNYCLVEVKPNWNDSTELLGYETVLDGGNYHMTKFTKFVVKAMQHPEVPFFVCLDEMNLAPVEQYFAEFLSILESRKDVDGTIKSEPLIPAAIFEKYKQKLHEELFPTKDSSNTSTGAGYYTADDGTAVYLHSTYAKLMDEGLRIPRNLIVVGTVNMDDTTYQFSRKVIDRAMTIEMNEVNLNDMFDTEKPDALSYREDVVDKSWFFAPFAQSNVALQQINDERELLAEKIKATIGQTNSDGTQTPNSLEAILGKTPFRIAYRVVNELILHFYALRWENKDTEFESLYNKALDNILMMKVLPRIEGNEDLVKEPLEQLDIWTAEAYPKANAKIVEMRERLECAHFTSFWP